MALNAPVHPPGSRLGYAALLGCAVVLLGIVAGMTLHALQWWPFSRTPTVHFILPAEFDGPFVVAVPIHHSASWMASAEYDFRIPSNGVLIVDDDRVLRTWHTEVVSTTDGALFRVPPHVNSDDVGPDRVFLSRGAATDTKFREHLYYFGAPGGEHDLQKIQRIEAILENISGE